MRDNPGDRYPRLVCGLVNARNRMGGYDGFRPYAYPTDRKVPIVLPVTSDGSRASDMAILAFPKECA